MKILIVGDSPELTEAVSICLQIRWPEVTFDSTAEGVEALEKLKSEAFDLVIMDVILPDIDGFEVLKRIRRFLKVPLICLTVRGKGVDRTRGLELGADDCIVCPFSPVAFLSRVDAVLRRARLRKSAGAEPSAGDWVVSVA